MDNPYRRAWARRRAHEREHAGLGPGLRRWLPVLGLGAAGPLLKPVFMAWLAEPAGGSLLELAADSTRVSDGVAGLGLRLGMLLAGVMSLVTYTALVRGPERAILDPFPAQPRALVHYLALRCAWERVSLPVGAAAMLLPVLFAGHPLAWALGSLVAAGGWLVGLLAGFTVHLGSVWAAESPALAGILNLLRGQNPKLQAALIYGPGVALAVGTAAVFLASEGVRLVLAGQPVGVVGLLAPVGIGLVSFLPAGALAERYHFRTTLLLAEVDGAYAQAEQDPEQARRVYLDWIVRLFPAGPHGAFHLELLKELRHGWRGLRSWITGAWGLGGLAALAGWSSDPQASARALVIGAACLLAIASVGVRIGSRDPLWLDQALPQRPRIRLSARAVAIFGWLQPIVLLPFLSLALRQSLSQALVTAGSLELAALLLAAISACFSALRGRGWAPYLLSGLALWAVLVGGSVF